MIITDRFVYIHLPKTGGTFVTSVLEELNGVQINDKKNYVERLKLFLFKKLTLKSPSGRLTYTLEKHSVCSKIPRRYRHLPILSTLRDPFEYYVSEYEFGWWKQKEYLPYYREVNRFNERYKDFPELSFESYLSLMVEAFNDKRNKNFQDPGAPGYFTESFIRYFFRYPNKILSKIDETYILEKKYIKDMFPVSFICTEALNRQLYQYLMEKGYNHHEVEFVLRKAKKLPYDKGRNVHQAWQKYFSPELKSLISKKDQLIFQFISQLQTESMCD